MTKEDIKSISVKLDLKRWCAKQLNMLAAEKGDGDKIALRIVIQEILEKEMMKIIKKNKPDELREVTQE